MYFRKFLLGRGELSLNALPGRGSHRDVRQEYNEAIQKARRVAFLLLAAPHSGIDAENRQCEIRDFRQIYPGADNQNENVIREVMVYEETDLLHEVSSFIREHRNAGRIVILFIGHGSSDGQIPLAGGHCPLQDYVNRVSTVASELRPSVPIDLINAQCFAHLVPSAQCSHVNVIHLSNMSQPMTISWYELTDDHTLRGWNIQLREFAQRARRDLDRNNMAIAELGVGLTSQRFGLTSPHVAVTSQSTTPEGLPIGGFQHELFTRPEEIKEHFKCRSCQLVLRDAVQTPCGHRHCAGCVERSRSGGGRLCPDCPEIDEMDDRQIYPDMAVRREVHRLLVACRQTGCDWTGDLKTYQQNHERSCLSRRVTTSEDDSSDAICKLQTEAAMLAQMDEIRQRVEDLQKEVGHKQQTGVEAMTRRVGEMEVGLQECRVQVQQLEEKVVEINRREPSTPGESSTVRVEQMRDNLKTLEHKLSTLEGMVAAIARDIEKTSALLESQEATRRVQEERLKSSEDKVKALERVIALRDISMAEQDLRIQALESASYNGVFLWKITEVSRKRHDAVSGRVSSLYSPAFYTSAHGYKMCCRLYLNGDGMGKGTHVSLFFVVMRGHYDALLRWPFKQKVTCILLDQNNLNHVIDAFRPDASSSSFKRPTSEMNIASGFPSFVPQAQLDKPGAAYIKDDCMFLKVIVDCSDL
ncbi:TNF receptor-associated factor 2 [Lingula anatina]|uniref:TNF receptor-associated factor 2 n=1 Tax=Lingula anatina TaxID=7574 RepID=A0A1S3K6C1_LINAN|nr:TNF receptor-associated factor 2 [Lingula anatina]|eukprot:XP_013417979.1 TNF receptor-associated factor 2 [Lingula anatina]